MVLIFDPDTPGGLRLCMDCRMASSSATAEDMASRYNSTRPTQHKLLSKRYARSPKALQMLQEVCTISDGTIAVIGTTIRDLRLPGTNDNVGTRPE